MENNLVTIRNRLSDGDMSCMTYDTINLMNDVAIDIIHKDSTLSMTNQDIDNINLLIEISNILYNNTTINVLPLDDGIYDMLMIIVKKYNPNYQIGARPVSFENRYNEGDKNCSKFNPFVIYDNRLNSTLYGNDFKYTWSHKDVNLRDDNSTFKKKVRNTSHNYPELVGTLDKAKFVLSKDAIDRGLYSASNIEILERDFFGKHMAMGLYGPNSIITVIAELKYDGISIEADVSNRILSARTRGDTKNDLASDYTSVLYGYEFPNSNVSDSEAFGMKFEAILTNDALRELNYKYGKSYKNARNAVQGILGSKDAYKYRDFITLVPLAMSTAKKWNMNRAEEINFLNTYYFNRQDKLYYQIMQGNYVQVLYQIYDFCKSAEYARNSMSFLYDGIVISYMDPYLIDALGRQNSVNKYQIAVKFEAMRKETMFLGYRYTVGQNGVITPMIYYKPIEFYGCIHNHSSGHSYERFKTLGLRYGDIIEVEYVNDVIPYVNKKVMCKENDNNTNPVIDFPTVCPFCGAPIYFTDKSASCSNPSCPERLVARVTNMLDKLNFKGFSESTVRRLGLHSFVDLISIPYDKVKEILKDKTADNFEIQRDRLITETFYDYQIIGSLGFQDIAEITWQLILANIPLGDILHLQDSQLYCSLLKIKGIGENTAETIINERKVYYNDIDYISKMPNVLKTYGASSKIQIRFTGCRDKELMTMLAKKGYDCRDTAVTGNTQILLVPYPGYKSNKTSKAPVDCSIIPIDEFRKNPIGIIENLATLRFKYRK